MRRGQRSLVGCSKQGHKGSDTTERLSTSSYTLSLFVCSSNVFSKHMLGVLRCWMPSDWGWTRNSDYVNEHCLWTGQCSVTQRIAVSSVLLPSPPRAQCSCHPCCELSTPAVPTASSVLQPSPWAQYSCHPHELSAPAVPMSSVLLPSPPRAQCSCHPHELSTPAVPLSSVLLSSPWAQ